MNSTVDQKPGCLGFFRSLFGGNQQAGLASLEPLPYRVRDDFLSPAEFSFYRILSSIVESRATIAVKVNLADVFYVTRPNENVGYRNRIASKHVDYLLCDPVTMKPLVAIELDDASHQRRDRKERDEFIDRVFQAAELPLLHVTAQREYNPRELEVLVAPFLKERASTSVVPATPSPSQPATIAAGETSTAPLCPKCGVPMVVRTVSQGTRKGNQFYGCRNFPRCREMKPIAPPPQNQA